MTAEEQTSFDKLATQVSTLTTENTALKTENAALKTENEAFKAAHPIVTSVAIVKPKTFTFAGRVGGPFTIDADHLGTGGDVKIGDRTIVPSRWKDTSIKGIVPNDMKSGETTVTVNGTTVKAKI